MSSSEDFVSINEIIEVLDQIVAKVILHPEVSKYFGIIQSEESHQRIEIGLKK